MLRPNMGAKAKDKGAGEGRIATNRRARHVYEVLDTFEAGIQLRGPEVKSLRAGQVNITDGFAYVRGGEIFLRGVHISPYAQASRENVDPDRERKLLLHRHEIEKLAGKAAEREPEQQATRARRRPGRVHRRRRRARSISRSCSRFFTTSRRSTVLRPRTSPSSTLARPSFQYRESGTSVKPRSAT